MSTKIIITLALLPLASGHTGLRAKQRQAQACDCDPYNYKYDLECCGPACAFPDSQFYDLALCSCDSCDIKGACFDMEHCCDPCIKESTCFSEEQCCDPCDPRSYCFDFYADCDIHYGTKTTNLEVTSVTVSDATTVEAAEAANATTVEATAVGELETTPVETAQYHDDGYHVDERPLYSISLDAFSPARLGGRSEGIGEIYLFGGKATSAADTTDTAVHVNVDGTKKPLNVVHEGYCTRTSTTGSVRGFCHWQYTVEDVGTFDASGGLGDPSKPSTLAIEGGTGILIGATGSVTIYGATVNDASFPNVAATIADPFAGVDGYLHVVKMYADDAFSNGSKDGVFKTKVPTTSLGNSSSVAP